jgi:hypothetical protein
MLLHAGLLYALSSVVCFTQMFAVIVSLYNFFEFSISKKHFGLFIG